MSVDSENAASLITPFFEVRQSPIQGKGAFATTKIRKGQRIIEYTGERISDEEADSRYDESKMDRHHTFLFTLDDDTVVDGAVGGNASIYINHSCDPNCEAVIEGKRIFIYALRAIEPEEELLYDYQYERENDEELLQFYKCLCGAPNCRGTIMKAAPEPKRKPAKKAVSKKSPASKKSAAKKATSKKAAAKKAVAKKGAKKAGKKATKKAVQKSVRKSVKKAGKQARTVAGTRGTRKGAKGAKKSATRAKRGTQPRTKAGAKRSVVKAAKRQSRSLQRSSTRVRNKGTMKKGGSRTKRTRTVR